VCACVCVCDLGSSTVRRPRPDLGSFAAGKKFLMFHILFNFPVLTVEFMCSSLVRLLCGLF
jgi:hypothetical protein